MNIYKHEHDESSSLLSFGQIIKRSVHLFFYLTILNTALGIILSLYLSGNLLIPSISGYLGNLALVEAAIFFLIGGATDFIHTAKWSQAKKSFKLGDMYSAMKSTGRYMERSQVTKPPKGTSTKWTIEESHEAERRALVYVLVGIFLCFELIFLALTMNLI